MKGDKGDKVERIKRICKKIFNKETLLYSLFGLLTSVLNVLLFRIFLWLGVEYKISNLITLIVVKITAYICNKNFVFKSRCGNFWELCKEVWRFIVARGATMLIDYFGLIILVEVFAEPKLISKVFVTVFVIVINYIVGKKHVFKQPSTLNNN